ncbi:MAG: OstA-like protein [Bacteroidales bacterium]
MNTQSAISVKKIFILTLLFVMATGIAQAQKKKKTRRIEIEDADSLVYNAKVHPDVRKFIGNVRFKHNDFIMSCDSAYSYTNRNKIDAYDNVHIERGDTLDLYGDFLSYEGNKNFGRVRENVVLRDKEATLTTDSLNFYTENNYAYYFDGGQIENEDKTITSRQGHYYSDRKIANFKDSVVIKAPDYTVNCDTLEYNTETEIAYFFGPTHIHSDENYLYCENGWYKTKESQFLFRKNAFYQKEARNIKGDTLFYDDSLGYGEIRSNAEIRDTTENVILRGNYSEYTDEPEKAFMTDSAHMISIDDENDSLYLHADTLKSHYDTTGEYRIFKAYYQAKIYKSNLQGKCDSLYYSLKDSIIRMYTDPVIWTDSSQVTAEFIEIFTENNRVSKFILHDAAFMISREAEDRFNQIKGKKMTGHFKDNKLKTVEVNGNGETIYYTKNKEAIVGVNKAASSNLLIQLKDNQVARVTMLEKPDGTLYPLGDMKESKLEGFQWLEEFRPTSKYDIFFTSRIQKPVKESNTKEGDTGSPSSR